MSQADGAVAGFRRLPLIARTFIVLTVLDAVARTLGLIEPSVGGDEIALFASFSPRDAWILLPAIVLIRRPTAPADTPWVYRGALVVAIVTLLARPTAVMLGNLLPADDIQAHVALVVVESVLTGVAFLIIGFGLERLNPRPPQPAVAGLANLAAFGVLGAFLVGFVASLLTDLRLDIIFSPPWWSYAGGIFHGACVAYFVRAAGRSLGDPTRSETATRTATSGALLWALGLFGEGVVAGSYVITHALSLSADLALAFELLQAVGPLLIVVGIGLGLADPLRPLANEWASALRADPRADARFDPDLHPDPRADARADPLADRR